MNYTSEAKAVERMEPARTVHTTIDELAASLDALSSRIDRIENQAYPILRPEVATSNPGAVNQTGSRLPVCALDDQIESVRHQVLRMIEKADNILERFAV